MKENKLTLAIVFSVALFFVSCNSPSKSIPKMTFVQGGQGLFGSTNNNAEVDEYPQRKVEIKSFYISTFEITQAEWMYIMDTNPSYFKGDNRPVECVSWYDVQEYIRELNKLTGKTYRLPTELEWEYAARGGYHQQKYEFSGSSYCSLVGWWRKNSGRETSIVGEKLPNRLGLYDMTGNVHEWCANKYDSLLYKRKIITSFIHEPYPDEVTVKGGCWQSRKRYLRIANRNHIHPSTKNAGIGFRLAMDAD